MQPSLPQSPLPVPVPNPPVTEAPIRGRTYRPILLSALVTLILTITNNHQFGMSGQLNIVVSISSIITAIIAIYSLVVQFRLFQDDRPRLIRYELVLITAASIAPMLGAFLGDKSGAAQYGNATNNTLGGLLEVLGVCLLGAVYLIATVNAIYIAAKFNQIVKVLMIILYYIAWLIITAASVVIYSIAYGLHEPTTE